MYRNTFFVALLAPFCAVLPLLGQTSAPVATAQVAEKSMVADAGASGYTANADVPKAGAATSSEKAVPVNDSYRVGVEDQLQISVWREPEISSQVMVRPDGCISLPLLNDIHVVGLSTKQLQDTITEKLKPFITEPQVTVVVREIRSRKVYLIGQVNKPGAYDLNDNKTVLQLLAEAGGLSQFAKSKSIYIVRKEGPREARLPFNYKKALTGKDMSADFALAPGDMIVVP